MLNEKLVTSIPPLLVSVNVFVNANACEPSVLVRLAFQLPLTFPEFDPFPHPVIKNALKINPKKTAIARIGLFTLPPE